MTNSTTMMMSQFFSPGTLSDTLLHISRRARYAQARVRWIVTKVSESVLGRFLHCTKKSN